jgi:hypothetical protein
MSRGSAPRLARSASASSIRGTSCRPAVGEGVVTVLYVPIDCLILSSCCRERGFDCLVRGIFARFQEFSGSHDLLELLRPEERLVFLIFGFVVSGFGFRV